MKSKMVLVIVGFMVMGICAANVLPVSQAYVATNNAIVMPAESTNPVVPNSPGESPVSPAASRDVVSLLYHLQHHQSQLFLQLVQHHQLLK